MGMQDVVEGHTLLLSSIHTTLAGPASVLPSSLPHIRTHVGQLTSAILPPATSVGSTRAYPKPTDHAPSIPSVAKSETRSPVDGAKRPRTSHSKSQGLVPPSLVCWCISDAPTLRRRPHVRSPSLIAPWLVHFPAQARSIPTVPTGHP